ncbi:MAG: efflux transporter outer membrane subunit [Comamonas sp.]|nr:efflux transporter outer membrane subunit [Comamonas sp.]
MQFSSSPFLRRLPRAALLIVALGSLSACHTLGSTAGTDALPALDLPSAWSAWDRQPNNADSAPSPAFDLAQWWQAWGDPTLTALVEQSLAANTSIASARAALEQSRAQWQLQQANALPSVGASASARRSQQGHDDARSSYGAGLDASWEVDWWGKRSLAIEASAQNLAASQASLHTAQVSLAAEVALQYIQLRLTQERLRIAQENLALQQETLQLTDWRVQAGLAASLDLEQARQSVAQTAAQIPALQTTLAQSRNALAVLTGHVPQNWTMAGIDEASALPQAPQGITLALPADTLRQRPDVLAQQHRVQAAWANLAAQERANLPTLRLSGSLTWSAATLGALTNGASLAKSIGAALAAPLFDGGANRAQIAAQQAAVEQARQSYRATVLSALQEVEDGLVQWLGDQERLVHLEVASQASEQTLLLAQHRYESGLVDFRTLVESQRSLLSSQDTLASAKATISQDVVRLFKAMGGGWSPDTDELGSTESTGSTGSADNANSSHNNE